MLREKTAVGSNNCFNTGIRIPVVCAKRRQKSSRQLGEVEKMPQMMMVMAVVLKGRMGEEVSAGKRIKRVSELFLPLLPTSTSLFEVEVCSGGGVGRI